jgi:hypothetical protein
MPGLVETDPKVRRKAEEIGAEAQATRSINHLADDPGQDLILGRDIDLAAEVEAANDVAQAEINVVVKRKSLHLTLTSLLR